MNKKQLLIRLTEEQHRAIKVAAANAGVSINALVVSLLERGGVVVGGEKPYE